MRLSTVIIFLLLFSASAQEVRTVDNNLQVIDSLTAEYRKAKGDSLKCLISLRISGFYTTSGNSEKYRQYCKLGVKHAEGSPFLMAYARYYTALRHLNQTDVGKFFDEIKKVQQALKKYNNPKSIELQLIIIQNLSTYYLNNHEYKESIEILTVEGLNLAKKAGNNTMLAMFYENIGRSFFNLGHYEKADGYFKKAISSYRNKISNTDDLALCYIFKANNLIMLKAFNAAREDLSLARKLLKMNGNSIATPHYYYVLGEYYAEKKDYRNAAQYYSMGIKTLKPTNSWDTQLLLKISLSEALLELKQFGLSYQNLREIEHKVTPFYQLSFLKLYSESLEKLKLFEQAYSVNKRYIKLKDSTDKQQDNAEFIKLEAKYNRVENENRILNLLRENQRKELELKNNQALYAGLGLLIFVGIISYLYLLKSLRSQRKISDQKDIIHNQNVITLKKQKEIEIMQAMIEGEEAERKRIARDLHDGIGSSLTSIKMQLENSTASETMFMPVVASLSQSIKELRQIAYNLVPETLTRLGLDAAISDFCMNSALKNTVVEYHSFELSEKIKPSHQVTIYRIVQELVNNALKHARATLIVVQCSQNGNLLLITVEDNGVGIDPANKNNGLGLSNIGKRVDVLGGKFEIHSAGTGTIINIELHIEMDE